MIIRGHWESDFTIIPNRVFNSGLTAEATGVLCYLIGKPSDWKVSASSLAKHFGCGRYRVNKIMRELLCAGYASMRRGGKEKGFDWVITDHPDNPAQNFDRNEAELLKKATVEKSDCRKIRLSENQALQRKEGLQSTEKRQSTDDDGFAEFWAAYQRKDAKQAALKAWKRLTASDRKSAIADIRSGRYAGKERQFVPHASTYLNGKRWNDEKPALEPTSMFEDGYVHCSNDATPF